ncbi:hypothetical protein P5G51_004325 [Virgibacillus sp. 179-BFC.A HS]|uniref:Uncharacterized protein n=1 Tax=Tigheibacillus jepli TaxID=3035914 RepID=A0ABU5CEG7_9BACI|nr:hypothetical protein [Virgibacillus sp. 179-BFC.A HS]MDY0404730.1 hypothetical protein [Virgibacillus sp. 179-BFC.A HS]
MKKVLIHAYTHFNFGDDLFIQILCERYPQTSFYLYARKHTNAHFPACVTSPLSQTIHTLPKQ